MDSGHIALYQIPNSFDTIEVGVDSETVWLDQYELERLFQADRTSISKHIRNIYKTGELEEDATCAFFAQVQVEGTRSVVRQIKRYNLDMIISIGYRVNSKLGILFRQWASRVLKDILIKGYAIKSDIDVEKLNDLKDAIRLVSNVLENKELSADEATALLSVVRDFTYALDTLDSYDHQTLSIEQTTSNSEFKATYEGAMQVIEELGKQFGSNTLFGNQKDGSFHSTISTIYQTFDGVELYPSVEEKAATLLYLATKNHSFSDGNKRIAAALFLWFLYESGILYKPEGGKIIENNTLVALTLMIAESNPNEMKTMVKVVVALINKNN